MFCLCRQSLITIFSCLVNSVSVPPARYWAHLCFLILRTQLWTEFMDYDADRACARRTTVCLFSRKFPYLSTAGHLHLTSAATVVFLSMLAEAVGVVCLFEDFGLRFFSVFGVVMFVAIEYTGSMRTVESQKLVMKMQTFGGLLLIGHIWSRKLFVDDGGWYL